MNIDITNCNKVNIIDSCSLWNVLSSLIVYSVVVDNNFSFSITKFVEYECLHKPRTTPNAKDKELQSKLSAEIKKNKIECHHLTIEDLQDDFILKHRNSLGMGELSSIAFAKKVSICFLTDDQKARKLGVDILGKSKVQTTPLVLGWLFYNDQLADRDLDEIIKSHREYNRPLEKHFRKVHEESLRLKHMLKK